MSRWPVSRRDILHLTGAGIAGNNFLNQNQTIKTQSQPNQSDLSLEVTSPTQTVTQGEQFTVDITATNYSNNTYDFTIVYNFLNGCCVLATPTTAQFIVVDTSNNWNKEELSPGTEEFSVTFEATPPGLSQNDKIEPGEYTEYIIARLGTCPDQFPCGSDVEYPARKNDTFDVVVEQEEPLQITIDKFENTDAWKIVEKDENITTYSNGNPDIELETGQRYRFANSAWSPWVGGYKLAFRDDNQNNLLGQGSLPGEFEDDPDVDWFDSSVVDGSSVVFTLTEDLANKLEYYVAASNNSMKGRIGTDIASNSNQTTWNLTVQASTEAAESGIQPGETFQIYPNLSNTGETTAGGTVRFVPASDDSSHNADYFGEKFNVESHNDDGGEWNVEQWDWNESTSSGPIASGESRNPSVEITVADNVSPGEYTFLLRGPSNGEDTPEATTTITVSNQEPFELFTDGFPFTNWKGANTPGNSFQPPHEHATLDEEWREQAADRWIDPINNYSPVPIPKEAVNGFVSYITENFADGAFTSAHCFGMVFTAADYYRNGVPENLSATSAREIPQPTGEYSAVGADIDEFQSTQALDWDVIAQGNLNLSPPNVPLNSDPAIDFEHEYELIKTRIDEQGVAPVGLGQSSDTTGSLSGGALHQVLAYGYEDTTAGKELQIYDPNKPDLLQFITISDGAEWSMEDYTTGGSNYDRLGLIGSARTDTAGMILGGASVWGSLIVELISDAIDGFVSIVANSPVEIEVTDPDGNRLSQPSNPINGTPPSEIAYAIGANPGQYDIEVTGTGDGSYTIDMKGSTMSGGQIDDSVSGTISRGETQTITAQVPTEEDSEGTVSPPDSDDQTVELSNVTLSPPTVSESGSQHTLSFTAKNVSTDGDADEFTITFPDTVVILTFSVEEIAAESSDLTREDNTFMFSVNPEGTGSSRDIAISVNLTLTTPSEEDNRDITNSTTF